MSEYRHIANLTGPQGQRGPQGQQGPQGAQGEQGPQGEQGIGSHGVISAPTDLNTLRNESDIGIYGARTENLINGPDTTTGQVVTLEVLYSATNGVTQRVSTALESWWRTASSASGFNPWRRVARADEVTPDTHGVIEEPTDLDELRNQSDVGVYGARMENLINSPDVQTGLTVVLEVSYGASNGIVQRITAPLEMWWRNTTSNDEWGPWRRIARIDEIEGGFAIHGVLSEPTDIDELRSSEDIGMYAGRITDLVNGPPADTGLVVLLEVLYGATNGIVQRVTTSLDVWWRVATSGDEWGTWRRLARIGEVMPDTHGVTSEATDIDQYRTRDHIGTYIGRAENFDGGPPVSGSNPLVTLEVHWGTSNGVIQRATTHTEAWWRGATSSSAWGPWRRYATTDDLEDFEPGTGSGIEYDDDGTPYIADGAGSNPQPDSRRLVTEQSLPEIATTSSTVRRIITSTDPDEPLEDGDLLLVYGE